MKAQLAHKNRPAHLQAAALRTSQPANCTFLGTSAVSIVAHREAGCQNQTGSGGLTDELDKLASLNLAGLDVFGEHKALQDIIRLGRMTECWGA